MSNDNKTLADAQPGGRVRLGDAPWPAIDAILADAYSAGAEGLPFEGIARRAAVRKAVAALSAQPSPGGQGKVCVPLPTPGNGEWSDGWNACRDAMLRGEGEALAAPPAQAVDLADFKALYRAYVRLLESGRDRILDLGGTCDPVDVMEANDVDLQAARRVLDSQAVGNG
ncbi:hypothetical protein QV000_08990 [Stenotrophomonas maltophilia]